MNEINNLTRQALPSKRYRELIGTAICVFNSNNAFIIENILNVNDRKYTWHQLIDRTSGQLKSPIKETISQESDDKIADLFSELVEMRNRIIHSFQITSKKGEQILHTKEKDGTQFTITEAYLIEFINKNEDLALMLDEFRLKHKNLVKQ